MGLGDFSDQVPGFLCLGVGLLLVVSGLWTFMARTPGFAGSVVVNGTVESSNVVEVDRGGSVGFRPELAYTYSFGGTSFVSTDIYRGRNASVYGTREKADLGYEEGDTITVYLVDVGSPESAFVKYGDRKLPVFVTVLGLLTGFVGVYSINRDSELF
jgi:hypothetical protein